MGHGHGWSSRGGEAEHSHAVLVVRQMMPKGPPPARVRIFHRHQADGFVQQVAAARAATKVGGQRTRGGEPSKRQSWPRRRPLSLEDGTEIHRGPNKRGNPGQSRAIRGKPGQSGAIRSKPGQSGANRGNPGQTGAIRGNQRPRPPNI